MECGKSGKEKESEKNKENEEIMKVNDETVLVKEERRKL